MPCSQKVVLKCYHRHIHLVDSQVKVEVAEMIGIQRIGAEIVALQNVQCASNACNKVHVSLVLIMTHSLEVKTQAKLLEHVKQFQR